MARRRYRAAMRGLDDRAGVDVAKGRALAREDARVVRHFLIGAEGTERAPGDRIEPVDRKYQQRRPIGDQIAARMVAAFVRQREIALVLVVAFREIARKSDVFEIGRASCRERGCQYV